MELDKAKRFLTSEKKLYLFEQSDFEKTKIRVQFDLLKL